MPKEQPEPERGLDLAPVGQLVAGLFEELEEDYGEQPQVKLRAALVAVDIQVVDAEGESWTAVRWHFGQQPDFDDETGSTAYAAGIASMLMVAFTDGTDEPPEPAEDDDDASE